MNLSLILILFSVCCGVAGQMILKVGMTQVGRIGAEALAQPLQIALKVATHPLVAVGLGLYVLGAVSWLTVLSRVPLSFAYPMLALSYAIVPILAWLLLGESVPSIRWIGIGAILFGLVLVSRG